MDNTAAGLQQLLAGLEKDMAKIGDKMGAFDIDGLDDAVKMQETGDIEGLKAFRDKFIKENNLGHLKGKAGDIMGQINDADNQTKELAQKMEELKKLFK